MNKQEWAYNEGYRTALRSLGIKDDADAAATQDADAMFNERTEQVLGRTKVADAFIDVDRYNEAEKFINDADGPIIQQIFEAKKKAQAMAQELNTLMSIGDKENISIDNASYGEIGARLNAISDLIAAYDDLVKVVTSVIRPAMDKYTLLMAQVTGQS